jgi:hypothetical protein
MSKFVLTLLLLIVLLPAAHAQVQAPADSQVTNVASSADKPYWNQHWRDSVNSYQGRLKSYHNEIVSYDLAFAFSFFPFASELFLTDQVPKAAVFFFARTAGAASALVGTLGLVRGQGSALKNVVMVIIGVAVYVIFKITEINEVQRDVSHINERLVDDFQIATADIDTASIRYPVRQWPRWVTDPPPARHPQSAQDVLKESIDAKSVSLGILVPF